MNRLPAFNLAAQSPFRAMDDSDTQRLREREDAILWVKSQMARYGITFEALESAGCFARDGCSFQDLSAKTIRYKDAEGHTWDGNGDLPDWLQRAVNAGQCAEHFRVTGAGAT